MKKYESEVGMMKESGVGQYVKLYDYRTLEAELKLAKKDHVLTVNGHLAALDKIASVVAERDEWRELAIKFDSSHTVHTNECHKSSGWVMECRCTCGLFELREILAKIRGDL